MRTRLEALPENEGLIDAIRELKKLGKSYEQISRELYAKGYKNTKGEPISKRQLIRCWSSTSKELQSKMRRTKGKNGRIYSWNEIQAKVRALRALGIDDKLIPQVLALFGEKQSEIGGRFKLQKSKKRKI